MECNQIERVSAAISYIEEHLNEKLDLNTIASAVCYSRYYLHRMFRSTVGITPHAYIQRRQLTEAAKQLAFSEVPVIEIALAAGYESQQAFTTVFKSMYKQTPAAYRRRKIFYPLQLEFVLKRTPSASGRISYAAPEDLPDWMQFLRLVIDGFPYLEEASHLEQIRRHIAGKQAVIMRDGASIIGASAFSQQTGKIEFLAVHPQYRRYGAARELLDFLIRSRRLADKEISITTFRAGDPADTGQRSAYKNLGFVESELLDEFGYPVQKLILPSERGAAQI